jgi:hypothetical protein
VVPIWTMCGIQETQNMWVRWIRIRIRIRICNTGFNSVHYLWVGRGAGWSPSGRWAGSRRHKTCGSGGSGSGFGSGSATMVSTVCITCGYREESWVVPIWTMGGMLTLAIILKILHLAAQHQESAAIYSLGNSFLITVRLKTLDAFHPSFRCHE